MVVSLGFIGEGGNSGEGIIKDDMELWLYVQCEDQGNQSGMVGREANKNAFKGMAVPFGNFLAIL